MAALDQSFRRINIDRLDADSPTNFDLGTVVPADGSASTVVAAADAQNLAGQIRQLLRGGDAVGALRGALENVPYAGEERTKEIHLATVIEILQSIKQSEMSPLLTKIYQSEGGSEILDVLMKYIYKGMSITSTSSSTDSSSRKSSTLTPQHTGFSQIHSRAGADGTSGSGGGSGAGMSVLLSWHEKLVEIVGLGSIIRVMTDRRTV